jgi:hypothetical protein
MTAAPDINDLPGIRSAMAWNVVHALAAELGLTRHENGRYLCPNPDHDDSEPGVSVGRCPARPGYVMLCGACPEPWFDAMDLLRFVRGLDFYDARKWLVGWLSSDAPPPSSSPPARRPLRTELVETAMAQTRNAERLARAFFADKGMDVDPAWAVDEWRLGARGELLWLPWFRTPVGESAEGAALVGATKRWLAEDGSWGKKSAAGSQRRDVFYGEHRDQGRPWVVLAEGESDCLALAWWLREKDVDVLGVAGAGAALTGRMERRLSGRNVVFVPDQDQGALPSEAWVRTWSVGLTAGRARAERARCSVAVLPRGTDAVAAGRRRALAALRNRERWE